MPLILKKIMIDGSKLLVWEVTENQTEIMNKFKNKNSIPLAISKVLNTKRIQEKLATSLLLQYALETENEIDVRYNSYGKPYLNGFQENISISHTGNFVAILVSTQSIPGIDIETIKPRIIRISDKFIHEEESHFLQNEYLVEQMHVIWGAKESMYKIYEKKGLDFKNNMRVQAFKYLENGSLTAKIDAHPYHKEMEINYTRIENCMLTWAMAGKE